MTVYNHFKRIAQALGFPQVRKDSADRMQSFIEGLTAARQALSSKVSSLLDTKKKDPDFPEKIKVFSGGEGGI